MFTCTKNASDINWSDLPKFLKIIGKIIDVVSPEIIITFGKAPFFKLKKYYLSKNYSIIDLDDENNGHGSWVIRCFDASEKNNVRVIGLPHLSIYTIYNRPDKLGWIKNQAGA